MNKKLQSYLKLKYYV